LSESVFGVTSGFLGIVFDLLTTMFTLIFREV